VFSDPTGKRWPRLRLILLIAGVLLFLGRCCSFRRFLSHRKWNVPFSLRQLKGQLKALQKGKSGRPAVCELRCFGRIWSGPTSGKKAFGASANASAAARKKPPDNEVRLAFYTNGDRTATHRFATRGTDYARLPGWMT